LYKNYYVDCDLFNLCYLIVTHKNFEI